VASFIVYQDSTGEILRSGGAPSDMISLQSGPGETALASAGENDANSYVDISGTPTITAKSNMVLTTDNTSIVADDVAVSTTTGVPVGTTVSVAEVDTSVDDGSFEFSTDTAGSYECEYKNFKYFTTTITITGT